MSEELYEQDELLDKKYSAIQDECIEKGIPWNGLMERTKDIREAMREVHFKIKQLEPIEWEEIPDYGHLMTMEDFKESVDCGGFIDYDGFGYYATKDKMSNKQIVPSDFRKNHILKNKEFTHVVWFNR